MTKDIPAPTRAKLAERAAGACEGCGKVGPTQAHHRKYRSRGGGHELSNLIALCGLGNINGCHGRAHGTNAPEGWALPSGLCRPALEPVLYRGERAMLDDAGQVHVGVVVF